MALGKLIGKVIKEVIVAPLEILEELGTIADADNQKDKPKIPPPPPPPESDPGGH